MKIYDSRTGKDYPSKYEWGNPNYWEKIVDLILSKRNLSADMFGSIQTIRIGNNADPLNTIKFEYGLEIYDEVNSLPNWVAEENDKILGIYINKCMERCSDIDYIKQSKKEIREIWFRKHKIKKMECQEGFQRIIWGREGDEMFQIDYVLFNNMIFITGNLGDAIYSLNCKADLSIIKNFDLLYFTSKLTAHQKDRWYYDYELAKEQIKELFLTWCNVDNIKHLKKKDKKLYNELISETMNWNNCYEFENFGVWTIYRNTNVTWFDIKKAMEVRRCGRKLHNYYIAYWLGLQMIAELLETKICE